MKKTIVLGATDKPDRYAYKAANMLVKHGHEIVPIGIKDGVVAGKQILTGQPPLENINTVTMYVGPKNQVGWYDYILNLKPERVIFNPGAENPEFEKKLQDAGIEPVEACTLVLLSINQY